MKSDPPRAQSGDQREQMFISQNESKAHSHTYIVDETVESILQQEISEAISLATSEKKESRKV